MALSAAMVWEVRTGGAAGNSGGFKAGASGTDRTLSSSAYITFTDLVIDAVDNTKVTSAGNPFDSTSPGNTILVNGGAGFTTGTFEILSVAAGVATLDRAVGTIGSTGGTGKLGGAKARLDDCDGVVVAGNTIYMESGTYTSTTTNTLTADGTATAQIRVIGYPSGGSRSDQDIAESNMPVMTSATNSIAILTFNAAPWWTFRNMKFTHSAATRGNGMVNVTAATTNGPQYQNCVWDGCLSALNNGSTSATAMQAVVFSKCAIRNCTSHGVSLDTGDSRPSPFIFDGCDISANAGAGIRTTTGFLQSLTVKRCVLRGQTGANGHGVWIGQTTGAQNGMTIDFDSNVFYNNAQSGVRFDCTTNRPATVSITNNIFMSNGAYGVSCATAGIMNTKNVRGMYNAYYNNTSGARQNFVTGDGDVTLTGSPFTNAGSGDFTLNNTASAGAACRSVGFPAAVGPSGATVGSNYQDIGPLQVQASAGGGTVAYGFAG